MGVVNGIADYLRGSWPYGGDLIVVDNTIAILTALALFFRPSMPLTLNFFAHSIDPGGESVMVEYRRNIVKMQIDFIV